MSLKSRRQAGLSLLTRIFVWVVAIQLAACTPMIYAFRPDASPPDIDVWYGDQQEFGALGLPQKWVNILGNISDSESGIQEVTFSVNRGKSNPLRLGPDKRRLVRPGDFNIEIDPQSLKDGDNSVDITAVNQKGLSASETVKVQFQRRTWPIPYQIDWGKVKNVQDVLQVVDGKWTWDASGIRPAELGYDRAVGIGDMSWTSYEVVARITLHGIDPKSYEGKDSPGAAFGINMHWTGHTDSPAKCFWPSQPHCGWRPIGALNWYSFKEKGPATLQIETDPDNDVEPLTSVKLEFGHTYLFKARVSDEANGVFCAYKIWEPGEGGEPAKWTMQVTKKTGGGEERGAILFVLHRVDATIGDISVRAVDPKK